MSNQKGKSKEAAKIALQLVKIKKLEIIKTDSEKNVDDIILNISSEKGFIVATQDKDLKRKLIDQGCSVIVLRQKKKLEIINHKGFV